MKKSCLVIGYGSIGRRHASILSAMGHSVFLVTSQKLENYVCFLNINGAFNRASFAYIIISNPTYLHYPTLIQLLDFNFDGVILVEKPLFLKVEILPHQDLNKIFIAYNLRFHELLIEAKQLVKNEKIIGFSACVGQYLPTWRKNIDYQNCYSGKKALGGGVLRELSHELDYALWFCGLCYEVVAMGGHYSELEIDSDDIFSILMRCENCPMVNLQLNFLSRFPKREVIIQTNFRTIIIDLILGQLYIDNKRKCSIQDGIEKTYIEQHKAILSGKTLNCCNFQQGLAVMHLIEAIEKSVCEKKWITV